MNSVTADALTIAARESAARAFIVDQLRGAAARLRDTVLSPYAPRTLGDEMITCASRISCSSFIPALESKRGELLATANELFGKFADMVAEGKRLIEAAGGKIDYMRFTEVDGNRMVVAVQKDIERAIRAFLDARPVSIAA